MKILIVYYSRTGNTQKVAEYISKKLNADLEQIHDLKNRDGIVGWILSGKDGMNKALTQIDKVKVDPNQYDLVILGAPIWVNTPPGMRTYLTQFGGRLKKAAFFCTMGGSGFEKMFQEMENIGRVKPVATIAITDTQVKMNTYQNIVDKFIQETVKTIQC